MADKDNRYSTSAVKKMSQCHVSVGKKTSLAKPKFDRWRDLNSAIIDWINNDAIEETSVKVAERNNFQSYDPIQKKILSDLFSRFRTIYPKRQYSFNHQYISKEIEKEINGEIYGITTHFAYEFEDEGHYELVRLKTAHDPSPDLIDLAILTKLKEDNEEFYTAALELDDLMDIDLIDNPDEVIDEYFEIIKSYVYDRQKRTPGSHCDFCDQASRCGQFPLINENKINRNVREVKVSKTNLVKLDKCERRTAWNVQYGLPREDYIEFESESTATKFHKYSQQMLVDNENYYEDENIEDFKKLTVNEDGITQEELFNKYKYLVAKLTDYENLVIKEAEYILGCTFIVEGKGEKKGEVVDQKVATIFNGKSDLAGRVGDTPIIIELKTRPEMNEDAIEAELYALGASSIMKQEDEIIVLHIYVSEHNAEVKERRFGPSEIESAKAKFESIANKPASWIPYDALSPKYTVGDWCQTCEFKNTCSEYR